MLKLFRRVARVGVTVAIAASFAGARVPQSESASKEQEVPRLIRYNGSVPAEQAATLQLTFGIYKDQRGGAPLWAEVQNVDVDETGHFSVLLGATSDGLPTEIFATNEGRWLGVQTGQEPEQPRVLLVSVPYALKAHDAETVAGHPVSDFVLSPGNSDARVDTGATSRSVPNGLSPTAAVNSGTGTPNVVPKFDSTGSNLVNSLQIDTGNAIGIGTSYPESFYDIEPPSTAQYAKFNNQPWSLRIGSLQDGRQFFGMGVKRTNADSNYVAGSGNVSAVNHSIFEMHYDGSIHFKQQLHQPDGTILSPVDAITIAQPRTGGIPGNVGIGGVWPLQNSPLTVYGGSLSVINNGTSQAAGYNSYRGAMNWAWGTDYGPEIETVRNFHSANNSFFLGGSDGNGQFHDALAILNPHPPSDPQNPFPQLGAPWSVWIGSPDTTQTDYKAQFRVTGFYYPEPLLLLDAQTPDPALWSGDVLTISVNGSRKSAVTGNGTVVASKLMTTASAPSSSRAACTPGELWSDSSYIYVCTANGIKRAALAEF